MGIIPSKEIQLTVLFIKLLFCLFPITLFASIIQIGSLGQIPCDSPPSTLYFFDIDDTLIDSPYMLGSKAWRKYLVESVPEKHDLFTLFVARHSPVDFIEGYAPVLIEKLQKKGCGVFGLTARERNIWYYTPMEGVDALTLAQLEAAEIFLDSCALEKAYPSLTAAPEYYRGVFFADIEPKGGYLTKLFQNMHPEKVVFVDDKLSQVESVEEALNALGIENDCYWYTYTDAKLFHPWIANIQLYHLWFFQTVLTDAAAAEIAGLHPEKDAEFYLEGVLKTLN